MESRLLLERLFDLFGTPAHQDDHLDRLEGEVVEIDDELLVQDTPRQDFDIARIGGDELLLDQRVEIDGVADEVAREALRLAMHKLPIKTKIVTRDDQDGEE